MAKSPESFDCESVAPAAGPAPVPPRVERVAWLLEDLFRLPGTQRRFGLDFILGLVPGIGDLVGLVLGAPILYAAVRSRLPVMVILVMLVNVLLDAVVGTVPVAGNVFDFFWKGHKKNLRLLKEPAAVGAVVKEAGWKVALLVGTVILLSAAMVALLLGVAAWLGTRLALA